MDQSCVNMDVLVDRVTYTIRISRKTDGVETEKELGCSGFSPIYATSPFGTRCMEQQQRLGLAQHISPPAHPTMPDRLNRTPRDPMPSTSDLVKKLYKFVSSFPSFLYNLPTYSSPRMLEDPGFQSVVSWGPQGVCFVVKACPWRRYQHLDSYPYSVGHERVHQVHSTSRVQAVQLCQFRPTTEQVRFPQGQKYRRQSVWGACASCLSLHTDLYSYYE
jgi:hypothetical protein